MITKEEFKSFAGINVSTYDTAITLIVNGVISFVQDYCKNVLVEKEVTEYFNAEDIEEDGGEIFLANRINITESSVKVYYNNGTEASPSYALETRDSYALELDKGIIKLEYVRGGVNDKTGIKAYKVVYTAGYKTADVPASLKLACLKFAGAVYNKRGSEGESSEGQDGTNVDFAGSMTPEIKSMLSKYKSFSI